MIQISYKDRDFIIDEMTEEEKEILQAEKPEMYDKHFKNSKELKNKKKKINQLKNYENGMQHSNYSRHY